MRVVFTFTAGARVGEQVVVDAPLIRLGRHGESEVPFDAARDLQASTRHAEIRLEERGLVLRDLGSANGTFVGGKRVSEHLLSPGDELRFGVGGPAVTVGFAGAPQPPPATAPEFPRAAALSCSVEVFAQGIAADLGRLTGEYDSTEIGTVSGARLLELIRQLLPLPPPPPADDLCPAALHVTGPAGELSLIVVEGTGRVYCDEVEAELSPEEAIEVVAGVADRAALAARGDVEREQQLLASRAAAGVTPVRRPTVPPTNYRTTSAATIDTSSAAPQLALQVGGEKLFSKLTLRVGFDWRTNTLWTDKPGEALSFIGDANLIEDVAVRKLVGGADYVATGDVPVLVSGAEVSWYVLVKVVEQPGLPPFRTVVQLHRKKDARALAERLRTLLAEQ